MNNSLKKKKRTTGFSYILKIYAFIMFCIYPLYVDEGYYNIDIAKCNFLLIISIFTIFAIIAAGILQIRKKDKMKYKCRKISITEKFLYLYMLLILLSYLLSPYRKGVLWGSDGWYLGTIPLLVMCTLAAFNIHFWEEENLLRNGCIVVSSIVFLLGICNRFSYYPINIQPQGYEEFISTLGNIRR